MPIDEKKFLAHDISNLVNQFRRFALYKESFQELRQSEFIILATINRFVDSEARGVKVSLLSKYMEITPAAVTHIINSLEESEYLERLADPSDRRIVLVRLTEKGKLICKEKEERVLLSFQGLIEFMGEQDSIELKRLLTSMYTYFKERK
ncbi:MAG: MarR family winged helix-turn-helix transcriptional regulator [Ruminiclostridium sp.]